MSSNLSSSSRNPSLNTPTNKASNILHGRYSSPHTPTILDKNETNHGTPQTPSSPQELNVFVTDLLDQMQNKFQILGKSITSRMDEMGNKIDDMDRTINELMDKAGMSESKIVVPPKSNRNSSSYIQNFETEDDSNSKITFGSTIGPEI